jgi:hypothetical protein
MIEPLAAPLALEIRLQVDLDDYRDDLETLGRALRSVRSQSELEKLLRATVARIWDEELNTIAFHTLLRLRDELLERAGEATAAIEEITVSPPGAVAAAVVTELADYVAFAEARAV